MSQKNMRAHTHTHRKNSLSFIVCSLVKFSRSFSARQELATLSATQQQPIETLGLAEIEIKDLRGITRNQGVEWIEVFIV